MDTASYRRALGRLPTGVTVITTMHDGILHGMTANTFTSVSLDPLIALICVDHTAYLHDLLPLSGAFAATVLAHDQADLSVWFSTERPPGDEFADVSWRPAPVTGCPVLSHGLAYVDCRVRATHPAGDHSVVLGDVVDVGLLRDADPLIFYRSGYRAVTAEPSLPGQEVPNRRSPKSPRPGTM